MSDLIDDPGLSDILGTVISKYGIVNLVETGTGPNSSGLRAADRFGLRGFSCDVFERCVENAQASFPRHYVHHGESIGFLSKILPELEGPTFFWLDGHCPTDPTVLPGPVFPHYEEIATIKSLKRGYERDVIWVDDITMIDVPDNPVGVSWDVELGGIGGRWYGAKEHSWKEYMSVIAETHQASISVPILKYEPLA